MKTSIRLVIVKMVAVDANADQNSSHLIAIVAPLDTSAFQIVVLANAISTEPMVITANPLKEDVHANLTLLDHFVINALKVITALNVCRANVTPSAR